MISLQRFSCCRTGGGATTRSTTLLRQEECQQQLLWLGKNCSYLVRRRHHHHTTSNAISNKKPITAMTFTSRCSSSSTSSSSVPSFFGRGGSRPSRRTVPLIQRSKMRRKLLSSEATTATIEEVVPEPTYAELRALAIATSVPFVGFGFMDNAILIVAGDAIDTSLGVTMGISTMCAAAIGNIISDVFGIMLGAAIEDFCARHLHLPVPQLTNAQRQLRSVRFANQWGTGVGMVVGCIIGMFPLLFIDSNKIQARKREAHLDSIFQDVMTEASSLIGAQRTCLYLIVNKDEKNGKSNTGKEHPTPTPDGKYLYAKYDAETWNNTTTTSSNLPPKASDRYIPLGRGIVSRAALTNETWNIYNVNTEPDYISEQGGTPTHNTQGDTGDVGSDPSMKISNMVCVPVLDAHGRAIAVIQAINKVSKGSMGKRYPDDDSSGSSSSSSSMPLLSPNRGFTNNDVQVLKALASHISVSLQRMYQELGGGDEELRLKDTITMLRDYGLQQDRDSQRSGGKRSLFPDDDE